MSKLFTIEDLTKELYISRNTAYKLARQMKHNKIGRRILISEDACGSFWRKTHRSSKIQDTTTQKTNLKIKEKSK